jgi:hypothetical protein
MVRPCEPSHVTLLILIRVQGYLRVFACLRCCVCLCMCVGAWVRGCVGAWVGAWVRGCVDAWVRGCVGAWVQFNGRAIR